MIWQKFFHNLKLSIIQFWRYFWRYFHSSELNIDSQSSENENKFFILSSTKSDLLISNCKLGIDKLLLETWLLYKFLEKYSINSNVSGLLNISILLNTIDFFNNLNIFEILTFDPKPLFKKNKSFQKWFKTFCNNITVANFKFFNLLITKHLS